MEIEIFQIRIKQQWKRRRVWRDVNKKRLGINLFKIANSGKRKLYFKWAYDIHNLNLIIKHRTNRLEKQVPQSWKRITNC